MIRGSVVGKNRNEEQARWNHVTDRGAEKWVSEERKSSLSLHLSQFVLGAMERNLLTRELQKRSGELESAFEKLERISELSR